ncbi:hypothetical protein GDO81_019303 [Engystomops pustulosus]|uniref:Uncharacterized protein n=1 Tax=Engystomops pustulosus TaxID=76066 RepID=A0AAV6Z9S8_ENGPU|nr:hypothetical protein GDO81_019303 [Engystomops pustulosus]
MEALRQRPLQHRWSQHPARAHGPIGDGWAMGQHPVHNFIELPGPTPAEGLTIILQPPVLQLHLLDLLPALVAGPVDPLLP